MGHFHSNRAFPPHQLEALEVPCSGSQTFLTLPGGQAHSLEENSNGNIDIDFSCSIFHDFCPPHTQVMKMRRCARSSLRYSDISPLSWFLFLFLFFSLTKVYYLFFLPSFLRVLQVLHNSTTPSQYCN